ncbi:MAG: hypothetical protein ACE5J1_00930 [Nitrospiria bacterium]
MKESALPSYDDPIIRNLVKLYFQENFSAQVFLEECERQGRRLVIDHVAVRCLNVDRRAEEFLKIGYVYHGEIIEYPDQGWWAKVYRKSGAPALFIDQAYDDPRGEKSIIPQWVQRFGDQVLHHAAVLVDNIEEVVSLLQSRHIEFSGAIIGSPGSRLRQVFTAAEEKQGAPYTVLELTERNAYDGFYPDQANRLMQSSTKIRTR